MRVTAPTLEVLVEEPSAGRALQQLLPRIVLSVAFEIREFRGKTTLLKRLPQRLAGYASRMQREHLRVAVLVDRDDDDCKSLKQQLEEAAHRAGLSTPATSSHHFQVINRIAVEEPEAWFFGDVPALCNAHPRVPSSLAKQARYRDPDTIKRGTWEALERLLQKHGYHVNGLKKLECAAAVAEHMNVDANRSRSFQVFCDGLRRLVDEEQDA